MSDEISNSVDQRREAASRLFREHPHNFPLGRRASILSLRVEEGMTPYEAHLAAGGFRFKVVADPKVWPMNADPYRVMWGQSIKPDDGEIWMMFENDMQFPERGITQFEVSFQKGKVTSVNILGARGRN